MCRIPAYEICSGKSLPGVGSFRSSPPTACAASALADIEAVKDGGGNIVGAVNCFQDITERKRSEAQIVSLAREAEHRTKNILSTVLATVRLSRADTSDDLKRLIEGRIDASQRSMGCSTQRVRRVAEAAMPRKPSAENGIANAKTALTRTRRKKVHGLFVQSRWRG